MEGAAHRTLEFDLVQYNTVQYSREASKVTHNDDSTDRLSGAAGPERTGLQSSCPVLSCPVPWRTGNDSQLEHSKEVREQSRAEQNGGADGDDEIFLSS